MRRGKGWSSTSCELRYLELPCDFLVFFLSDRLANGSILSTIVVVDMLVPKMTSKTTTTGQNTIYRGAAFEGLFPCISITSELTVTLFNALSCQIERIPFKRIIQNKKIWSLRFYEWLLNINDSQQPQGVCLQFSARPMINCWKFVAKSPQLRINSSQSPIEQWNSQ